MAHQASNGVVWKQVKHVPALAQVLQHADVAFFFGMIDMQQRIDAMTMQLQISQLIADGAQ